MPKTSRATTVYPIVLRELEVLRIHDVTPGMRRVTLTGRQLEAFTSSTGFPMREFRSPGFDDDVRLYFTYPGETQPILPEQGEKRAILPKDGPSPLSKTYTVRRYDPVERELDVDFVKHGTGTATTWAYRAAPGDRIHLGGPSSSRAFPTAADWLLVVGDDTALPAIGRLLDEAPDDLRAQVFIEISRDEHRQRLRDLPGVTVTWLSRDGAPAGNTTLLQDAVRDVDWGDGAAFAWVAGEQVMAREIRRYLIEHRGLAKEDIEFSGYWKRSEVVVLKQDAALPDPEKNTAAFKKFHDLAETAPSYAIQAAVQLGLGDLISRGVTQLSDLASRTSSDERALGKLLRYLIAIDVISQGASGGYGLTEIGEFLANEFWIDALHPGAAVGSQYVGLRGLAESVRTGRPAYASVTGRRFAELRQDPDYEHALLESLNRSGHLIGEPLANATALDGVEHVVIHSDIAAVLAREIVAARPDVRITVAALPTQAEWLRRDLAVSITDEAQRGRISVVEQSIFEQTRVADTVLIVRALGPLADGEAAHALRRARESLTESGRLLVLEDTFDLERLDEHDGEADLIALTRDGTGLRTDAELDAVIASAGCAVDRTEKIGWGATVRIVR